MLVFHVTFKCKPDMRDEFLEMIVTEGIDEAARAEAGNRGYAFYFPADAQDDLFLIEKYTDMDAVKSHASQPYIQKLTALKEEYTDDMILEMYVQPAPPSGK